MIEQLLVIVFVVMCIGLALVLALCLLLRRMIVDLNAKIDAIGKALAEKKQRDDALAEDFKGLTAAFYKLVDALADALAVPETPAAHIALKPNAKARR